MCGPGGRWGQTFSAAVVRKLGERNSALRCRPHQLTTVQNDESRPQTALVLLQNRTLGVGTLQAWLPLAMIERTLGVLLPSTGMLFVNMPVGVSLREDEEQYLWPMSGHLIAVNSQHCWEFNHRLPMERVNSISIDGSVQIHKLEFIDGMNRGVGPGISPMPSIPSYPAVPSNPGTCTIPAYPSFPATTTCVIPPPEQLPGYNPGGSNLAPVYNPSIPYAYPIYGGLKPGMMVYISGRPSASAQRFTINFQNGTAPYPPPDIAFHLDVRFFSRSVVRNSRTNNVWGGEENMVSHFPFQPAVNFDMIIRVEFERFMVAVNGQHFVEFRHRLKPLDMFDTLDIENDIIVSSIRFA
ncbi:Galectin-4 [Araneus ventricosus]|uniref:Galectin n=1 Tax=Araneus ventricosus TaxID=182803 RepID=A0A4Y2L0M0_ARAVE|nr:Galectin-4 [Araneus ventricosus]